MNVLSLFLEHSKFVLTSGPWLFLLPLHGMLFVQISSESHLSVHSLVLGPNDTSSGKPSWTILSKTAPTPDSVPFYLITFAALSKHRSI